MVSKNQIKLVKSLELKKNRKREGLFVSEGPKVVGDLLKAGFRPHTIFCTESLYNVKFILNNKQQKTDDHQLQIDTQTVTDDELRKLSFLQHPQQILGIFHLPEGAYESDADTSTFGLSSSTLALALDGVQDPGNAGTIIRIADWFGIDTIFCSLDTADAFSPKVTQATMGSLAHVHIIYCDLVELLSKADCPIYGTLLDGEDIYTQNLTPNGIIVMGNEGNGISEAVRPLITQKLLIPNFNKNTETAESLNVAIATAITCSEFKRRF